jgi:hypothetical protein
LWREIVVTNLRQTQSWGYGSRICAYACPGRRHIPNRPRSYTNRGAAYKKLGQLDKSVADDSEAIRLDPKGWMAD